MENLKETNRKDIVILKRKGEVGNLRVHKKKLQKGICLNDKKVQFSPEKYIHGMDRKKNVQQLKE